MTKKEDEMQFKPVTPSTILDETATYAVLATWKDEPGTPFVKTTGTYDECADYVERNSSLDNVERYVVGKEVSG